MPHPYWTALRRRYRSAYVAWLSKTWLFHLWTWPVVGALTTLAVAWSDWKFYQPGDLHFSPGDAVRYLATGAIGGVVIYLLILAGKFLRAIRSAQPAMWADGQKEADTLREQLASASDTANRLLLENAQLKAPKQQESLILVYADSALACGDVLDAFGELPGDEPLNGQPPAQPEKWERYDAALERYREATAKLPRPARAVHERLFAGLSYAARRRDRARVSEEDIGELQDIRMRGELDLDIGIYDLSPQPFVATGARRRFAIVPVIVSNREPAAVSLLPNWWMYLRTGLTPSAVPFDPDSEALQEWEEHRKTSHLPASPWLPMPLNLAPAHSLSGYWCFGLSGPEPYFPGNSPPENKPICYLEIFDTISRKRARGQGRSFNVAAIWNVPTEPNPQS